MFWRDWAAGHRDHRNVVDDDAKQRHSLCELKNPAVVGQRRLREHINLQVECRHQLHVAPPQAGRRQVGGRCANSDATKQRVRRQRPNLALELWSVGRYAPAQANDARVQLSLLEHPLVVLEERTRRNDHRARHTARPCDCHEVAW